MNIGKTELTLSPRMIALYLCHGGCSQTKLETQESGCLKGYSDEDKMEYICQRIEDLYYEANKQKQADGEID